MTPSPDLIKFLECWEGPPHFVPRQDPVTQGVWDIGYGHVCNKDHPSILPEAAVALLTADVKRFGESVEEQLDPAIRIAQHEYDALVSFAFNLGINALAGSTLLKKVNGGDFDAAANEFGRWNKSGSKVIMGLVKRRAAEKAMFVDGDYSKRP